MNASSERRQFLRSAFHAPVQLSRQGHVSQGLLHDISLRGALVETSADWGGQTGDKCQLRLALAPGVVIVMEMTVTHSAEGRLLGLHCDHIDLDSMTHLRQLIEHNAEDPALLERDLAMLVTHG